MYSEKKSSVGAARALPSAKTSGMATARTSRAGRKRPRDFDDVDICTPRAESDLRAIVNGMAGRDKAVYGLATVSADEALPRDHIRVPDERPRLRADQGAARVARARRGGHAGGGGRHRLQHLHRPRE